MGKRNCLFCCSYENKLSREHVIAQWLLNEVGIYDNVLKMFHVNTYGKLRSERTQVFNKLVNGLVCEQCNNGWMSSLEGENKDGIINLMNIDSLEQIKEAIEFINRNHFSLAKWIFKNAILFNYSVNYRKIVPRKHFINLYEGSIPDDVFIDIGFTKDYEADFDWSMGQTILAIKPENIEDYDVSQNYKISFRFRHLLVKVVRYRSHHNTFYEDGGAISLYPKFGIKQEFIFFENLLKFDTRGVIHVY